MLIINVFFWTSVFMFLYILYKEITKLERENKELREKIEHLNIECNVKQMQITELLKDDEKKEVE